MLELPSKLAKMGLKLLHADQIEFMIKLFDCHPDVKGLLHGTCHPALVWFTGDGYAIATFYVNKCDNEQFIDYSYKGANSWFKRDARFETPLELVEFLEINYQLSQAIAVWSSTERNHIGYSPDWDGDDRTGHLVPLTLEAIALVPQPERRYQLEELLGMYGYDYSVLQHRLKASKEQAQILWFGETGFRLQCMLAAELGDEDALEAWRCIKSKSSIVTLVQPA